MNSAAALCIKVGSFYDPQAAQGLSHLLEHMLFHNDNDQYTFHNYIHQHNGYWNSKTSNEHTIFYFSISNRYFNEAIDLFVKHFMYPTLNVDGMRKSIEKIDMEFQKLKTRDYAKLRGFISSLAVKGSPYRLFGRGNKLSLISEPEKNGINVNELLMKHWSTLYSSHRMTLAVQSKDSLNTLERIVREKFSSIPANRSVKLDLSRYENSFDSPDFFKLYHEQLRMVWAVPSVCALYKSNPIAVLGYFLSDKHPYGLENYLKNNHLATEVKCEFSAMSDFDNSTICAIITICIDLNGTRTDYFKVYSELLDTLSKQQACLIHSSKLNTTMHRNIHTEKWYNLQYTQEDVSMKQIGCIDDSYGTVPFSLPLKVNGSTHEYSTFPSENDTHTLVNLMTEFKGTHYEDYGVLWYQQMNDLYQMKNEVYMYTQLYSGMELDTPLKACLSRLLQLNMKIQSSNCDLLKVEPRIQFLVNTSINGPEFIIKGSGEKISPFYKEFLKNMTVDLTKEHFTQCKKQLTDELNAKLMNPNQIAENLTSCLWYTNEYPISSLLNALKSISIADLMSFQSKYFYQLEIRMYIVGDVIDDVAKDLFTYTVGFFKCHPISKETKQTTYISLQPGIYYHSILNPSMNGKCHQIIQYEHFYKLTTNSLNTVIGTRLSISCQSSKHNENYVINCIDVFWKEIASRVIACVDYNNLEQICDTIISSELVRNNDVETLSQFYWDKIKTKSLDEGKKILKREVNREGLLEYFYKIYLNPIKQTKIFIHFKHTDSDELIETSDLLKTNIKQFNSNLTSYLKDEDLVNTPYEYTKQSMTDLKSMQIIKKIKNIESFRVKN
ncbi:Nardilysin [Schistosoma japonicum]|nr:Nardilysin [Schistosoma japonicum]